MRCSICIATYRRPGLLDALIESLFAQQIPAHIQLEIIVVDNDARGSARETVTRFSNTPQIRLDYYIQPRKNISLARNLAVEKASGEYLLFIDDDETARPDWVINLVKALHSFHADAVFGCVVPIFGRPVPGWVKDCPLFTRPCPPAGMPARETRTGNCIVKATLLKEIPGPFDPNFGTTGGEDTQLFTRLKNRGAVFVSCPEAVTFEFIPPERTRICWMVKRAYARGNTFTRREIEVSESSRTAVRLRCALKALCYAAASLLLLIVTLPSNHRRFRWLLKVASNIGHLYAALGHYDEAYK